MATRKNWDDYPVADREALDKSLYKEQRILITKRIVVGEVRSDSDSPLTMYEACFIAVAQDDGSGDYDFRIDQPDGSWMNVEIMVRRKFSQADGTMREEDVR